MENSKEYINALRDGRTKTVSKYLSGDMKAKYINLLLDDKHRPIHLACQFNHINIVKLLIENNCIIDCESKKNKHRPIHYAVSNGHIEIVKLLIENNCDIECEGKNKRTPILYAILNDHHDIARLLIENNCNIACKDINRQRPIHYAATNGRIDIVKLLISKKCDIECIDKYRRRPIHYAADKGHIDIVRLLVEMNCNAESKDSNNRTALDLAKMNNRADCFDCLEMYCQIANFIKKNDVEPFRKLYNNHITEARERDTRLSLLSIAVNNEADRIVQYLMNKRIEEKELDYLSKVLSNMQTKEVCRLISENILYRCICERHVEGFQTFCSADVINGQHKLVSKSFLEIVAENGNSVFIKDVLKKTIYSEKEWDQAIILARENEYMVKAITNRQSMIESRLKRHFSLLHTAVCDNDADMVKYILDEEICDPNINHDVFGTALALAHSLHHDECISVLERFDVNPNTQNKYLQTPLHEAIESGTFSHCEYLIEKSDNIDKGGFNNFTALHCAVMEGNAELCDKLLAYNADCTRNANFATLNEDITEKKRTSNSILSLSSEENPLTLCLKLHGTIYPCFLQQLDYDASNCCDARKNSLLHLAALCYQPELTKLILEKGALVNEVNKEENSCLWELLSETEVSIERSKMDSMIAIVKELVAHDANITNETGSGMTMIQCASRFNDERLLLALLSKPSKFSNQINVTEEDFKLAFTKRWFKYAEVLVKVMSDEILSTYITKEIIETSLTYANSNLTQLLFDRANAKVQQLVIEDILYKAAMSEEENLFDHLKDVEIFCPKVFENGENLLTTLMKETQTEYCKKLIYSNNARRFASTRNKNGQIPLQIAIELEELDIAELLVSKTTEINSEDDQHETALIQLLKKISTCDSKMEHRLLMVIQSVIWRSASISVVTAEGVNVFDICKKRSLRAEIEQFYEENQSRRKPSQTSEKSAVQICSICVNNAINCVLKCGHPFCMECADRMDVCAVCRKGPVKYRRLYL